MVRADSVEIKIIDEIGTAVLTLAWRKRSKRVCYRFLDSWIAMASFKELGRQLGIDEDTWTALGI
jgi:hypothetical protein